MFNRDNLFGSRQPQQSPQPPSRTQPQPAPRQQDPRYRQPPPPDQEMRGYSNGMPAQQPPTHRVSRSNAGMSVQLRPAKSPDNSYTFGNLCAVNSTDIPPSHDGQDVYLLVNGGYVLSARPLPSFPRGHISLSDAQRTWLQVALTDTVDVQPYDPFSSGPQSYLGSMDVEVGFAGKKSTDVPYVPSPYYCPNFIMAISLPWACQVLNDVGMRLTVCSSIDTTKTSWPNRSYGPSETKYSRPDNSFSWISRVYLYE